MYFDESYTHIQLYSLILYLFLPGLDKEAEWLYSLSAQVYGPEVMHQPHLLAAGPTQRLACDRACSLIRLGDNQGLQRHLAGCEQAWSKSGAGNVASLYNTVVLVLIDKVTCI